MVWPKAIIFSCLSTFIIGKCTHIGNGLGFALPFPQVFSHIPFLGMFEYQALCSFRLPCPPVTPQIDNIHQLEF
jgi:hypothetical protein